MTQVFISYSRKDLAFVERLAKDLKAAGLGVWYDLSGLDGGARWGREIQSAIQLCQIFVVVLSPNSIDSEWVEKEFMYANSLKRKIIPLLYQPCETPMWFINLHFIDVQGDNYDSHFWVVLKAMGVKAGDAAGKEQPVAAASVAQALPETPAAFAQDNLKDKVKTPRTPRIRPDWMIALVALAAVIAFAVWGMPALSARLAPTSTPTTTKTPVPTLTLTLAPSLTPTISLMPTTTLGIGSTLMRPADGMVMVYVPAGNFSMGSNDVPAEQPEHTVFLDAYWIDKTDVTNAMYAKCVQNSSCIPSRANTSNYSYYYTDPKYGNFPVIWQVWNDAQTYCYWAGARLPTEAEWEKAARGTDGRIYPWGNTSPSKSLLNYNGDIGHPTAVSSYPSGASPYGALDMAGNVWEWVSDWYDPNYYASSPTSNPSGPSSGVKYVVRGGAFDLNEGFIRSITRGGNDNSSYNIGFRCASSAP